MHRSSSHALALVWIGCVGCASPRPCPAVAAPPDRQAEVERFNEATIDATKRMDEEATLALWEQDGVSLLPASAPVVGKPAIRAFLHKVLSSMPGARVRSFDMRCSGLEIEGDVATEYCEEHQIVDMPEGKPPFDGHGKLLYVLHRGADRTWRARREMWNAGAE
jgi:ketosteroid isomerase-like protein